MSKPFGGPLGNAGRKLAAKYLEDFREMIPAPLGRADADAAAIGGLVLTAMHRLYDAGASAQDVEQWTASMMVAASSAIGIAKAFAESGR